MAHTNGHRIFPLHFASIPITTIPREGVREVGGGGEGFRNPLSGNIYIKVNLGHTDDVGRFPRQSNMQGSLCRASWNPIALVAQVKGGARHRDHLAQRLILASEDGTTLRVGTGL